jgi:hypothetical protein
MAGEVMNDELERIYKEVVMTCSDTCLGGMRKTMKTLRQDNWCPSLPNTRLEHYHNTNLLSHTILIKKFKVELKIPEILIPL